MSRGWWRSYFPEFTFNGVGQPHRIIMVAEYRAALGYLPSTQDNCLKTPVSMTFAFIILC